MATVCATAVTHHRSKTLRKLFRIWSRDFMFERAANTLQRRANRDKAAAGLARHNARVLARTLAAWREVVGAGATARDLLGWQMQCAVMRDSLQHWRFLLLHRDFWRALAFRLWVGHRRTAMRLHRAAAAATDRGHRWVARVAVRKWKGALDTLAVIAGYRRMVDK